VLPCLPGIHDNYNGRTVPDFKLKLLENICDKLNSKSVFSQAHMSNEQVESG